MRNYYQFEFQNNLDGTLFSYYRDPYAWSIKTFKDKLMFNHFLMEGCPVIKYHYVLTFDQTNYEICESSPGYFMRETMQRIRVYRKKMGMVKIEYVWRLERGSKKGRLHYHLLVSDAIDLKMLRNWWENGRVNETKVKGIAQVAYLLKYATKSSKKNEQQVWAKSRFEELNSGQLYERMSKFDFKTWRFPLIEDYCRIKNISTEQFLRKPRRFGTSRGFITPNWRFFKIFYKIEEKKIVGLDVVSPREIHSLTGNFIVQSEYKNILQGIIRMTRAEYDEARNLEKTPYDSDEYQKKLTEYFNKNTRNWHKRRKKWIHRCILRERVKRRKRRFLKKNHEKIDEINYWREIWDWMPEKMFQENFKQKIAAFGGCGASRKKIFDYVDLTK